MENKIYIASPFFNDQQNAEVDMLEFTLEELDVEYFSPRLHNLLTAEDLLDPIKRRAGFNNNLSAIDGSTLLIANIEGMDKGTFIEIGYAHKAKVPVLAFSVNEKRKLNLMETELYLGLCIGKDALTDFLIHYLEDGTGCESCALDKSIEVE